jgi:hypothetical protein
MAVVVTAGQRGDSPQYIPVLAKERVTRAGTEPSAAVAECRP